MHINKLHHTKNSIDIYNGLELWRRDNFSICILRFFDRPDAEEDLGRSIVHVPCNEGSVVANWEGGPVGATCKHIRFLGRSQGDMGMWSYYKELLSQSHMYRTGWNMLDGGHFLFHGLKFKAYSMELYKSDCWGWYNKTVTGWNPYIQYHTIGEFENHSGGMQQHWKSITIHLITGASHLVPRGCQSARNWLPQQRLGWWTANHVYWATLILRIWVGKSRNRGGWLNIPDIINSSKKIEVVAFITFVWLFV